MNNNIRSFLFFYLQIPTKNSQIHCIALHKTNAIQEQVLPPIFTIQMTPIQSNSMFNIQHNHAQPVDVFLIIDEQDQVDVKSLSSNSMNHSDLNTIVKC